jgi:hypothetical protein
MGEGDYVLAVDETDAPGGLKRVVRIPSPIGWERVRVRVSVLS